MSEPLALRERGLGLPYCPLGLELVTGEPEHHADGVVRFVANDEHAAVFHESGEGALGVDDVRIGPDNDLLEQNGFVRLVLARDHQLPVTHRHFRPALVGARIKSVIGRKHLAEG